MAQYWFDFEDWPVDSDLSDYLAAAGLSTMEQVRVQNDVSVADKNYLELSMSFFGTNQRRGFVFKTVPDAVDIEMYGVELENDNTTNRANSFRMHARAQAGDGDIRSYFTEYLTNPDSTGNYKYDTGYASVGSSLTITRSNTVKYAKRFQVFGTSPVTLKQKRWVFGNAEPVSWSLETTDSTPSTQLQSAGKPGIGFFTYSSQVEEQRWLHIGIGTDGDPAPTGPLSTTEAFALRHNPRTNKVIPTLSLPTVTDIGVNCVRPRVTKGY